MNVIIKSFLEGFFLGADSVSALKYGKKAPVKIKESDYVLPFYSPLQILSTTDSLCKDAVKLGLDFNTATFKVIECHG